MAGVLPGVLIALLYSGYIVAVTLRQPHKAPRSQDVATTFLQSLWLLAPVLLLISLVMGSIYSGVATPSEAAAVGVAVTIILLGVERQLSWAMFREALTGTVLSAAMVCSILVAAALLSTAMGYLHLPRELATYIASLELTPAMLLLALALFYVVLGLFLDGISITVMSLPITLPIVIQGGFDPLWFGIFLVIMVELGQITPPVGFNLFVLQGLTGERIGRIAYAAIPFFALMCIAALMVSIFPEIVLWLPQQLAG
jgi:tripartite ATP-independent transporter DctM subunit